PWWPRCGGPCSGSRRLHLAPPRTSRTLENPRKRRRRIRCSRRRRPPSPRRRLSGTSGSRRGGMMFGYHIGVDIGGTFTDAVAIDEGGRLYRAKAPTTPADYTAGILAALDGLAAEAGAPLEELLRATRLLVHA